MTSTLVVGAAACDINDLKALYDRGDWQEVIAVDGGYETLRCAGIHPSRAIGDFDSLGYVPTDVPTNFFSPIKDKSDMELAFDLLDARSADEAYLFGALGGRLDHTLANLSLMAKASEAGLGVIAIGASQVLAMLTGPSEFHLPAADCGVVSVFSMNDTAFGVTERGLYYPLEAATLTNRTSLGLSNELIGEPVSIAVSAGTIAILYPKTLLLGA